MYSAGTDEEQAIGHDGSAVTQQDVSNPALDRSKYAGPSGEKMKALVWLGKNHVEVRKLPFLSYLGIFGYSHFTGGFVGGQAEYVCVPFRDVNLLKLPDSVPDEKGLYLSDVICTSWNAVVDTGVQDGDVVAIWGAGPVRQIVAEFSFHTGAARVILIDNN
ncbi:hypothetical protein V494_01375 [Pseudogymnoascus sp. VKM F-4513 (FW-928)]|nr:hypothetical protein V494_01375 [Pseudogymnoascus sp. VKM F-4513 (FW-928)]